MKEVHAFRNDKVHHLLDNFFRLDHALSDELLLNSPWFQ